LSDADRQRHSDKLKSLGSVLMRFQELSGHYYLDPPQNGIDSMLIANDLDLTVI